MRVAVHDRIPIVAVPLDAPEKASVIAQPRLIPSLRGCHDITVFLAIDKAAASCASEGPVLGHLGPGESRTRLTPLALSTTPGVNYWHSAEFTWDGQYVVFDDESFTGTCQPNGDGKIRIYRVSDAQLMSSFMIPRPQGGAYCSVHNGNIIPVGGQLPSRRGLVLAAARRGRLHEPDAAARGRLLRLRPPTSGQSWSSYWYNGRIYSNDMNRGVDVFNLLTPYRRTASSWTHLNAQTQEDLYLPSVTALGPALARKTLRRPDGPSVARQDTWARYCSSTRLAFAIPRLMK